MDVQIINPITYAAWDDLLLDTPGSHFFHSSSWARVLAESYRYIPLYFTVIENGKLRTLMPIMEVNSFITGKRGISLPFTDYCDPVILNGIPFPQLLNCIIEYGEKHGWKYLELRGGDKYFTSLESTPRPSSTYFSHTLDLTQGEEGTFSNLRDSTKRNIKKAVKEGVSVGIFRSLDSVQQFYRLNCLTRKDHGLPPQPYCFFKKVYDHVLAKNLGFVVLASFEGASIAGGVYFHMREGAVYKYGASDKTFQHLRPNNLVMWEGIRECIRRGCMTLSLGRTDLDHEGLLQFKRGWAAKESALSYFKFDFRTNAFVKTRSRVSGVHNQFFRALPPSLSRWVGTALYQHFA
jgi:hypothetical protein